MTDLFLEAFQFTLGNEGNYSNDPNDSGGETKYGISKRQYPHINIKDLTIEEAKRIYFHDYWDVGFDMINGKIAKRLFDLGVNLGLKTSIKLIQKTLNKYYNSELKEDGSLGGKTIEAIKSKNNESLYSLFIFETSLYYQEISERKNNKVYFAGWLNRLYRPI